MANKGNQTKLETRHIYIRSQRRWQEVPEKVYQEHIRFHDTYRHRMQNRGFCCCPRNKWWVCDADCLTCEYRNADVIASLDAPIDEESDDLKLRRSAPIPSSSSNSGWTSPVMCRTGSAPATA